MIALISALSFTAWIYLIGFHGRFWRSTPVLPLRAPSGRANVAAVVPARNEAANICCSLASLLAQNYPDELAILLVDDNSSDDTAFAWIVASAGE